MPQDLETLDDDLAAGRIDASTYRRRRDELLAGDVPPARGDGPGPAAPAPATPAPPVPAPPVPAPPVPAPSVAAPVPPTRPVGPRPAGAGRDVGVGARRQPSPPVPAHLTAPPWGPGVLPPGRASEPARPAGDGSPPVRRPRARMQGPEVFGPPGPRPLAVLGAVLVVTLSLAVLVASFLL